MPNARYWSRSKPFCAVVWILCYLISIPNIIQVLMCKYSGKYYRLRGIIIEERYKAGKTISPVVRFKFNDEKIIKNVKIITYAEKYREGALVTVYYNENSKSDEVWIEEEFDKFTLLHPFLYGTLALIAMFIW